MATLATIETGGETGIQSDTMRRLGKAADKAMSGDGETEVSVPHGIFSSRGRLGEALRKSVDTSNTFRASRPRGRSRFSTSSLLSFRGPSLYPNTD